MSSGSGSWNAPIVSVRNARACPPSCGRAETSPGGLSIAWAALDGRVGGVVVEGSPWIMSAVVVVEDSTRLGWVVVLGRVGGRVGGRGHRQHLGGSSSSVAGRGSRCPLPLPHPSSAPPHRTPPPPTTQGGTPRAKLILRSRTFVNFLGFGVIVRGNIALLSFFLLLNGVKLSLKSVPYV